MCQRTFMLFSSFFSITDVWLYIWAVSQSSIYSAFLFFYLLLLTTFSRIVCRHTHTLCARTQDTQCICAPFFPLSLPPQPKPLFECFCLKKKIFSFFFFCTLGRCRPSPMDCTLVKHIQRNTVARLLSLYVHKSDWQISYDFFFAVVFFCRFAFFSASFFLSLSCSRSLSFSLYLSISSPLLRPYSFIRLFRQSRLSILECPSPECVSHSIQTFHRMGATDHPSVFFLLGFYPWPWALRTAFRLNSLKAKRSKALSLSLWFEWGEKQWKKWKAHTDRVRDSLSSLSLSPSLSLFSQKFFSNVRRGSLGDDDSEFACHLALLLLLLLLFLLHSFYLPSLSVLFFFSLSLSHSHSFSYLSPSLSPFYHSFTHAVVVIFRATVVPKTSLVVSLSHSLFLSFIHVIHNALCVFFTEKCLFN